jgi:hypothetical protein
LYRQGTGAALRAHVTGTRLRSLRTRLRLSQQRLARLLGVSTATIHRWETQPAAAGPLGVVRIVLCTLERAVLKDESFSERLTLWSDHGQAFVLTKLFAFAGEGA